MADEIIRLSALIDAGDLGQAERGLRALLQEQPRNGLAWTHLARVALLAGHKDDAIELAAKAQDMEGPRQVLLPAIARIWMQAGVPGRGLPLLDALSSRKPDLQQLRGQLSWAAGRYDQALRYFRQAHQSKPRVPSYAVSLGKALIAMGQRRKALAVLDKAAEGEAAMMAAWLRFSDRDPRASLDVARRSPAREHPRLELMRAACHYLLGDPAAAEGALTRAGRDRRLEPAVTSLRYWQEQGADARLLSVPSNVLRHGLKAAPEQGLVLEFGVFHGRSIRQIAAARPGPVHGFDSFSGLPEAWGREPAGSYSTLGELPKVPDNVTLHAGWFDDTLPDFLAEHPGDSVALVHIDCDLYSSTRSVLEQLAERLVPGTVVVFDDYLGYRGWQDHEYRAWQEFVTSHRIQYRYLAMALAGREVAVRIDAVGSPT
ncbi:class I SAM-dependent methyltransferase [Gammaproteobacteria bacterium AB-CW1]|uniref:Class I SAM-dependent methyltransferase n=1 Tax=Natronospira elongata TaxID=3110268 RepID=A0AAP6JCR2_9GAMM|nr:class I SAM-dependent methyltransferase [Gammaproteobacteria bacterium AB-CW1]